MKLRLRLLQAVALPTLAILAAAGCGSSSSDQDVDLGRMYNQKRGFRVVNLTTSPIRVTYDNLPLQGVEAFGQTTGFILARPGPRKVEAKVEGGATLAETLDVPAGETKTVYAILADGKPKLLVLGGDERTGQGTKAAIRALNMSEGVQVSDVKLDGPGPAELAAKLSTLEGGKSALVEPGAYSVSGNVGGKVIRKDALFMESGRSYSLVLAQSEPGGAPEWVFLENNKKQTPTAGGASPVG